MGSTPFESNRSSSGDTKARAELKTIMYRAGRPRPKPKILSDGVIGPVTQGHCNHYIGLIR